MPMHEDRNIESDLEDMEDELYEENSSVDSNNDIECDDNSSVDSNPSNYSTTTNVDNNKKQRKDYIKINNNEENLKVLNRLKKNNLNLQKCKDNIVLNDNSIDNFIKLISEIVIHYGGLVVLKSTLCPIQEIVFTVSLPETEEFSVESAPVESAPVVRLIYYNFHPYKFCGDIELVLEEVIFGSILIYNDLSNL
ncbi:hypothetical protein MFLAVUS_011466 [Mucor flavus]|uniref:Uncharacterized protein n=1 Tax=Mucor flavus TaxID=439312 RepID=A0ABP9ZFL5_9FUNG